MDSTQLAKTVRVTSMMKSMLDEIPAGPLSTEVADRLRAASNAAVAEFRRTADEDLARELHALGLDNFAVDGLALHLNAAALTTWMRAYTSSQLGELAQQMQQAPASAGAPMSVSPQAVESAGVGGYL